MAALTAQVVPHAGVTPTLTSSLGGTTGNTAPCGAGLGLMLVNGAASTVNVDVHVASSVTVDGLAVTTPAGAAAPSRRFTLPAVSGSVSIIPLPPAIYADPTTGLATFDVAAGTVSAAVVGISA